MGGDVLQEYGVLLFLNVQIIFVFVIKEEVISFYEFLVEQMIRFLVFLVGFQDGLVQYYLKDGSIFVLKENVIGYVEFMVWIILEFDKVCLDGRKENGCLFGYDLESIRFIGLYSIVRDEVFGFSCFFGKELVFF